MPVSSTFAISAPPSSRSSSPRKKRCPGQNFERTPLTLVYPNGDPGPSQRSVVMNSKRRPPRSPVKYDAGVDRLTIRASGPRSTSSAGRSTFRIPITSKPLTGPSPAAPSAPPPRARRPSMVLYGPLGARPVPIAPPQVQSKPAAQIGPFKFLRSLPRGTFGKALVAHDRGSGRVVCTRVFEKSKMRADAGFHAALLAEFLCYKHIAARPAKDRAFLMETHAVLQDAESVVFVMPLMHCDLLAAIRGRGERHRTRRWVAQVALGLDALHGMGIIHRDIKPENILLDARTDTARIADFNAAYLHPGNAPLEDDVVYTREYIGSKPYLAPEIARKSWYGKMVDWWALGCVMFDLISGEVLFATEAQRTKYMNWDPKREGTSYLRWATDLSREEETVLLGLLRISPRSRFRLKDLQRQRYFVDENGTTVFHALSEQARRAAAAAPMAYTPDEKVPDVSVTLENLPLCYAVAQPCRTGSMDDHDFYDWAWVNQRGLWGSLS